MIRFLLIVLLIAPAVARANPPIGPADTGGVPTNALGRAITSAPPDSSLPRATTPGPATTTTTTTGHPSEACRKFPNLC